MNASMGMAGDASFVCDKCRYRHEFRRDIGKTLPVEPSKHEESQTCTGLLCRRCAYGGGVNRAARRANRGEDREAVCLSRCGVSFGHARPSSSGKGDAE